MTIDATLYVLNKNRDTWKLKGESSANLGAKKPSHAERQVYQKRQPTDNPVLIVQNGYPCTDCNTFFNQESSHGMNIIIKVTGDQGSYGAENGFPLNKAPKIAIFYYHNGSHSIVTMTSVIKTPPAGFPNVPEFEHL